MKPKLLILAVAVLISTTCAFSQSKTDYDFQNVAHASSGPDPEIITMSSTYWLGKTWLFFQEKDGMFNHLLHAQTLDIDENGNIHMNDDKSSDSKYFYNPAYSIQVSSCIFNYHLFVLWSTPDHEKIVFNVKEGTSSWKNNEVDFHGETERQMAAVAVNDTLYLFYVDRTDHKVKYFRGTFVPPPEYGAPSIAWTSNTPITLSESLTAAGNVTACSYTTTDNKEKILVTFACDANGKNSNDIGIFKGIQDQFELFAMHQTPENYPAENLAIEQASVKGGFTQQYVFQIGYSVVNYENGIGPVRCEFNLDDNQFSDWEITSISQNDMVGNTLTGFMTYYVKESYKRKKHLYQLLMWMNLDYMIYALHWNSDQLIYDRAVFQVPPLSHATKFYDLIVVVEGAPPYALNGWKLGEPNITQYPPSTFTFTKQDQTSVTTTTTYKQSIGSSTGAGPVTYGFKASFMESSGTSTTKTVTIENIIHPPYTQLDSCGIMWYYYIAPTVKRSQWRLCDYDGNTLTPSRNLFLFSLESPQIKNMTFSLADYSDSPLAYKLESYELRDVVNMHGMEKVLMDEQDLDIIDGGTGSLDLTFSESHTDVKNFNYSVKLGIDAEYDIFSASADYEASFDYKRERKTEVSNGFNIKWANPGPKVKPDTNNVTSYTAIAYVMKTTDTSAYYLLGGYKDFTPYFITYEVENLEHGPFELSIDEHSVAREKYKFSNFPNPCSEFTSFVWTLPGTCHVSLSIYNASGRVVNTPVKGMLVSGKHHHDINTSALSPGIYYYQLMADKDLITGKFVVSR